jgi:hypothetical protein
MRLNMTKLIDPVDAGAGEMCCLSEPGGLETPPKVNGNRAYPP